MNPQKKSRLRYLRIIIYFLPVLAIIAGYGLLVLGTHENYPFTIVTGTSMQPSILPGSVALIAKVPFNQLQLGNVIVFTPRVALQQPCDSAPTSSLTGEVEIPCFVIHRVVNIQTNGGQRIITTKGDNNQESIPNIDTDIDQSMYIGKVILQFPLAGYVTEAPYNEYLAAIIFAALIVELAFERKQSSKEKQKQSEAAPGQSHRETVAEGTSSDSS
jgi:signal peptidase I